MVLLTYSGGRRVNGIAPSCYVSKQEFSNRETKALRSSLPLPLGSLSPDPACPHTLEMRRFLVKFTKRNCPSFKCSYACNNWTGRELSVAIRSEWGKYCFLTSPVYSVRSCGCVLKYSRGVRMEFVPLSSKKQNLLWDEVAALGHGLCF